MSEEKKLYLQTSTVMGTGDAEGVLSNAIESAKEPPKYWFIARVAPNTEKAVREKLQAMGYEVFVASQQEQRFWKNGTRRKRKIVEKIIITQYIFLYITTKDREALITYSFIKEFMRNKATREKTDFAMITNEDMVALMQMLSQPDYPVLFDTRDYTIGEQVLVRMGSYNYTARVVRKRGSDNIYYGIRINELGCAYIEAPPSILGRQ